MHVDPTQVCSLTPLPNYNTFVRSTDSTQPTTNMSVIENTHEELNMTPLILLGCTIQSRTPPANPFGQGFCSLQ